MDTKNKQEQHLKDAQHIINAIPTEKSHFLNLADDQQYRYLKNLYQMNGLTPERYPRTFQGLEDQRENDLKTKTPSAPILNTEMDVNSQQTGFFTLAKITSLGTANGGTKACATAFIAIAGGVTTASASLYVYDNTDPSKPKLLTNKTINIGTTNFIAIETVGGTPSKKMYAMLTYSYTPAGGKPVPTQTITINNNNGQGDPSVSEPIQKDTHKENANIRIALSRGDFGRKNNDVDYWFNKGLVTDTTIIVPFVGSATFANPLDISTLKINLTVGLQDGGASTQPSSPSNLSKYFTLSTDKKTLSWDFPANGKKSGSKGNPIVYGTAPWVSDTITYFFASIGINPKGSLNTEWIYIQSTDIIDETKNDGTKYIKPLVFLWHCLAEGTLVILEDGSTLPIEEVNNSHTVLINNNGDTLPVLATTLGEALPNETYKLVTDHGRDLILSSKHVVITSEGAKQAKELKAGDIVVTKEGETTIASVKKNSYIGKLYNLELGIDGNVPIEGATFFANGISVGDYQMQSQYNRTAHQREDYVLSHLPEEWHTDYRSYLEDKEINN